MLLIIALSIGIVWVCVLAVLCGVCRSAAAGDRGLPRRTRVSRRRFEPAHRRLVG
jgi:hypothetical protein